MKGPPTASPCVPAPPLVKTVAAVWTHPDGPDAGVRAMNAAIQAARASGAA